MDSILTTEKNGVIFHLPTFEFPAPTPKRSVQGEVIVKKGTRGIVRWDVERVTPLKQRLTYPPGN